MREQPLTAVIVPCQARQYALTDPSTRRDGYDRLQGRRGLPVGWCGMSSIGTGTTATAGNHDDVLRSR